MNTSSFKNNNKARDLGLYIHIPFCVKKCDYCDFLSAPASDDIIHHYFDAMLTEIEQYYGYAEGLSVPTIFFGGGTPSFVDASYIEQIMLALQRVFPIDKERLEASIEINPGTISEEKLRTYHRIGLNRLSFGLQSVNSYELSLLGRIHTYEQFEENYYLARQLGFTNINIDLMSALPGQTLTTWEDTIQKVVSLQPEHISAYSLIVEEGTKFYEQYKEGAIGESQLPEEETDRLMYDRTKELLGSKGYHRYEISNYAKDGYECRHNSSYWIGTDYLGIGLGSASLLEGNRFHNVRDLSRYIKLCQDYHKKSGSDNVALQNSLVMNLKDMIGLRRSNEKLTKRQSMDEFMILGLRMCKGIKPDEFFERFGIELMSVYGNEIEQLKKDKLLESMDGRIRLTDYGIDISNYVLAQFLQ